MLYAHASPLQVGPLHQEFLQLMIQHTTHARRLVKRGRIIWEAIKGLVTPA